MLAGVIKWCRMAHHGPLGPGQACPTRPGWLSGLIFSPSSSPQAWKSPRPSSFWNYAHSLLNMFRQDWSIMHIRPMASPSYNRSRKWGPETADGPGNGPQIYVNASCWAWLPYSRKRTARIHYHPSPLWPSFSKMDIRGPLLLNFNRSQTILPLPFIVLWPKFYFHQSSQMPSHLTYLTFRRAMINLQFDFKWLSTQLTH